MNVIGDFDGFMDEATDGDVVSGRFAIAQIEEDGSTPLVEKMFPGKSVCDRTTRERS